MNGIVGGIDIGGALTKACLVADGRILARATLPTELDGDGALTRVALAALDKTLAETGHVRDDLEALGVGVPGKVNGGAVSYAANLGIDGAGLDLGTEIADSTGLPTFVENDMRSAAFGCFAQLQQAGSPARDLVYVGIGTGVSAGVVLNGSIHRGSHGLAGEIGHVPVGTGQTCLCGSVGCLETILGAGPLSQQWGRGPASDLFAAAAEGDPTAGAVAADAVGYLAQALWWLAAAYDPDLFFIGGGVGANSPNLRRLLVSKWAEMATHSALAKTVLSPDRIRTYDLEEPVGALGAALLAIGSAERSGKRSG